MSMKPKVLLCEQLDEAALALLREKADVHFGYGLSAEQLQARLPQYQGLLVGGETYLPAPVIEAGEQLRVIGRTASNTDRIDVAAAQDFGIDVVGTPLGSSVAVAEQVMLLILQLSHQGLDGKTLGLVGFGRIAKQVASRAKAFNMNIVVNQPRLTPELAEASNLRSVDLPTLLRQSDFVSLHVPHLREGDVLIGSAEFEQMPPTCTLINLAHNELVDMPRLLTALRTGQLASAAITDDDLTLDTPPANLRIVQRPDALPQARAQKTLVRRFLEKLRVKRPSETLSLDIVPIDLVMPHEAFDQKRVDKLKASLSDDGVLVNPPLVTPWAGKYVILDGATRFNSLKQLGYPHVAVQLVQPDSEFALHTWYHAISSDEPASALFEVLQHLDHIAFEPISADDWLDVFEDRSVICYFVDRDDGAQVLRVTDLAQRAALMNQVVATYTAWGDVERTLLTDTGRLLGQFPRMAAVAIFPQFTPHEVFDVAKHGQLLPAGLTRFAIPGRVLRLNIELQRLKSTETITQKRSWLNSYLAEKLKRSHIRYYQEPVILIDG